MTEQLCVCSPPLHDDTCDCGCEWDSAFCTGCGWIDCECVTSPEGRDA